MDSNVILIKVGDKFPKVKLYENSPKNEIDTEELLKGKKVVIFGVPGAFTPGCSKTHLPGYISDYQKYKDKGIDYIVCVSVNDPFVMEAWGKLTMLIIKLKCYLIQTESLLQNLELLCTLKKSLEIKE